MGVQEGKVRNYQLDDRVNAKKVSILDLSTLRVSVAYYSGQAIFKNNI